MLDELKAKGVQLAFITLHVGLGTFRPVSVDNIDDHEMHSEYYQMTQETADLLNQTKRKWKANFSVGTTSTRTLETIRRDYDKFKAASGWTDIFIYPGFEFKAIDGLITNFHLPKSTFSDVGLCFQFKTVYLKCLPNSSRNEISFLQFR